MTNECEGARIITGKGNRSTWRKPTHIILNITNLVLPDMRSNQGHSQRPMTNYGKPFIQQTQCLYDSIEWLYAVVTQVRHNRAEKDIWLES
jgi:hypothetical protein